MKTKEEILRTLLAAYPALAPCQAEIESAYALLLSCAINKGTVLVCGNGGSAADSEHIVGELMKGFHLRRPLSDTEKEQFAAISGGEEIAQKLQGAIRAISLVSQSGLLSAFANDVDASLVFAQQVYAYAQKSEDVLIALSTSGNSLNVVNAAITAKACGIKTLAITGGSGGKLAAIADTTVCLPANTPYEVQEFTLPVYHALCAMLEAELFSE